MGAFTRWRKEKKKREEEAVKGVLSVQPIWNIPYRSKMDSCCTPNLSDNIFFFSPLLTLYLLSLDAMKGSLLEDATDGKIRRLFIWQTVTVSHLRAQWKEGESGSGCVCEQEKGRGGEKNPAIDWRNYLFLYPWQQHIRLISTLLLLITPRAPVCILTLFISQWHPEKKREREKKKIGML